MKISFRIFLGYFLIVGLAAYFILQVFVNQVKPGVRQSMESSLVDTANVLAQLASNDLKNGVIADGEFSRAISSAKTSRYKAGISEYMKEVFNYRIIITDDKGKVMFDSDNKDVGKDYSRWNDIYLTLRGQYGARSTRSNPDDETSTVMYVAAPIMDGDKLIGVLSVANPNASIQPFIEQSQKNIVRQGSILIGVSFLIGLAVTFWFTRSLDKLGKYAKAVSAGERAVLPDLGRNEMGELGNALDTMRKQLDGKQYVEQYVQTLTHEMKSPLAAIRGASEILEENPAEIDRVKFLDNAIDFSPEHGVIKLSIEIDQNQCCVKIRDQGVGIPDYATDRLFERFYSLPRPDTGQRSSGLGLSFVMEVALAHKGDITLANLPEGGVLASFAVARN